jgi:hypothetical protein
LSIYPVTGLLKKMFSGGLEMGFLPNNKGLNYFFAENLVDTGSCIIWFAEEQKRFGSKLMLPIFELIYNGEFDPGSG